MASQDLTSSKQYIAAGYDEIATRYLAWAHARPGAMEHRLALVERLHAYLGSAKPNGQETRRGLRLLELGCGAGEPVTLALAAHPAIGSIVANDISTTQLEMLRDKLARPDAEGEEKVQRVHGDMMALSFPECSLDAVLAFYSTIHLPQTEQTEMILRVHRWLKPDSGYFVVSFGAEESAGVTNENWLGMKSFWSSHGVANSLRIVEDAGFEVVHKEVKADPEDAPFLWVIGRKKAEEWPE